MARNEKEGLVILLDVSESMSTRINNSSYLQTCVDIVQMIVQRKMFQSSKDELALILFGTRDTANALWDGSSDHFTHVTVARPLSAVNWKLLEFIQNDIAVSNLQGDIIDGVVVASNHFHEEANQYKVFKEKRIIILTDYSSGAEDDGDLPKLCKGFSKHGIRVDVVSPFSDNPGNDGNDSIPRTSRDSDSEGTASNLDTHQQKPMTDAQRRVQEILSEICESSGGAMYSFNEVLTLLSCYQAKMVKSSGTKYLMKIGETFKMPIVSMIKVKENKPDLFKFKKVYAKDETVELKTERARYTKDEEQRDLDEKTDVVDAYRYGTTYVPIDDTESIKLKVEKCFDVLGFTKSENIKRHYFLSEGVQQIMPDPSAGDDVEEAFTNMVHSMFNEDVYGLVRRVFSSRSSPELACLIPYISNEVTCLLYMALPFDEDMRGFTLENFNQTKRFKANETQLNVIDELIDSMDLTQRAMASDEEDEAVDELYDPHTTFNPYIQRMFQSIAQRATAPDDDLPDFENHITSTHLTNIGTKIRNEATMKLLKRCADAFPLKLNAKKTKVDASNIFDKQKQENRSDNEEETDIDTKGLNELLSDNKAMVKVKKIGTSNPVKDFKYLADKLSTDEGLKLEEFEELCQQLQILTREIFNESLVHMTDGSGSDVVIVFMIKAADCIQTQRDYCLKFKKIILFNTYLSDFKQYLIDKALNKKYAEEIKKFWQNSFVDKNLSLISKNESSESDVSNEESNEFLSKFMHSNEIKDQNKEVPNTNNEDVEDLLDLM